MFGSCRFCSSPTDKWQDFCNACAPRASSPRFRLIPGGKKGWERPGREKPRGKRWLSAVPRPPSRPPEV